MGSWGRYCFCGTRPKTLTLTPHFQNTESQEVETVMKRSEADYREWMRERRPLSETVLPEECGQV